MTQEHTLTTHPHWQQFKQFMQEQRAQQTPEELAAVRAQFIDFFAAYRPVVDNYWPRQLASQLGQDLHQAGFETELFKFAKWKDGKLANEGFIDILALHPDTHSLYAVQVDKFVPRRHHVDAIHKLVDPPDLTFHVLTQDALPDERLATALRDAEYNFEVFGIVEADTLLTPEVRDTLLDWHIADDESVAASL